MKSFIFKHTLLAIILLSVILGFNSCNKKIDINDDIEQLRINQSFTLAEVNPSSDWDSAYVVAPYNTTFSEKIEVSYRSKSNIESMAYGNEGNCTLIFLKNRELVSYAFVGQANCSSCVNFAMLNDKFISRNQELSLDAQKSVKMDN